MKARVIKREELDNCRIDGSEKEVPVTSVSDTLLEALGTELMSWFATSMFSSPRVSMSLKSAFQLLSIDGPTGAAIL